MKGSISALCLIAFLASTASCGYMAIGKRDNVYETRPSSAGGKAAEYNSAVIIGAVSCPRDRAVLVMAWDAARDAGLTVLPTAEAVAEADVIMVLIPDHLQGDTYETEIKPVRSSTFW